jgi:hypothetical protein
MTSPSTHLIILFALILLFYIFCFWTKYTILIKKKNKGEVFLTRIHNKLEILFQSQY